MGNLEDWQCRSTWADGTTFTAHELKTLGLKKILRRRKKEMKDENTVEVVDFSEGPKKRGPKPDYPGPDADTPAAENVVSHGKGRGRNEWLDKKLVIIQLEDEPAGVRKDSKRWRNQLVILQCKTVGEALDRLSALTSPGSGADIRLAVKKEIIRLEAP
jgi:hypothetical protein|tara:strand:+ start:8128 stop:8604 length:477 start_codon:yes stop_codon:yes gene_type:complete